MKRWLCPLCHDWYCYCYYYYYNDFYYYHYLLLLPLRLRLLLLIILLQFLDDTRTTLIPGAIPSLNLPKRAFLVPGKWISFFSLMFYNIYIYIYIYIYISYILLYILLYYILYTCVCVCVIYSCKIYSFLFLLWKTNHLNQIWF